MTDRARTSRRAVDDHDDDGHEQSAPTFDEIEPVGFAVGSDGDMEPVETRARSSPRLDPYYDVPPDDPRSPRAIDVDGRLAKIERETHGACRTAADALGRAKKAETWNRRIFYALSALTGVAGTAVVFAFALTRASGEAAGEKQAIDKMRTTYWATIDRLAIEVARNDGRIGALTDRLNDLIRARFLGGSTPTPLPSGDP